VPDLRTDRTEEIKASPRTTGSARERPERPPPCAQCDARCWWNGWRVVLVVQSQEGSGAERMEKALPRAKCCSCKKGFTCYADGLYPRRQYQLDVVAAAVAEVTLGRQSVAKAAQGAQASLTSVRRWIAWIARLAAASTLLRAAAQLDPEQPVGVGIALTSGGTTLRSSAAQVLTALEALSAAVCRGGVALVGRSGLARILDWQRRVHGDVVHLVGEPSTLSPGMALGVGRDKP
jgi:hypothetical protein